MHDTFPTLNREYLQHRSATDFGSFWLCLGVAAMPVLLATAVAMFRFGSNMTVGNIVDVLSAAAAAAPL